MNSIGKKLKKFGNKILPSHKAGVSKKAGRRRVPDSGEVAWADGLFFGKVPMERWNPDELIWRKGFSIYRKMMLDDQIKALISLKQAVLTSRTWHFTCSDSSPQQRKCKEFFRFILEKQLEGTVSQFLREILTSQTFGFSLIEKIFTPVSWEGGEYWGIKQLKLRPAESFSFKTDVHGNLIGLLQEQAGTRVELPRERFILSVNKPEVHAQYGESDLRECHRHWWAKENILKFWNVYLERMASGFIHGRITGPLTPGERDDLKKVMQNLNSQTSIITPSSVELKVVSAPSTTAFEEAVAARDKAIAKALLVPNLLGFSEQGRTGSYSQSKTQLETFFLVVNGIAETVADTLNEQLFRELAHWNFGLKDPPLFKFDPLTDSQKREFATAWMEAVGRGAVENYPEDQARTRELLGYPAGENNQG